MLFVCAWRFAYNMMSSYDIKFENIYILIKFFNINKPRAFSKGCCDDATVEVSTYWRGFSIPVDND